MPTNKTVLIIDDDARNTFALSLVLRSRGYNCLIAASAAEGMQLLAKHGDIGIVLIDMMMPDMDGYTAIPLIRTMDKNHNIPIIAVTAQAMVGDKERCIQAGATSYISKPVDVDALISELNKHLI